jgi:hypothetical protein
LARPSILLSCVDSKLHLCSPHHRRSFVSPIVFRSSVFLAFHSFGSLCWMYNYLHPLPRSLYTLTSARAHAPFSLTHRQNRPRHLRNLTPRFSPSTPDLNLDLCLANFSTLIILAQSVYICSLDSLTLTSHIIDPCILYIRHHYRIRFVSPCVVHIPRFSPSFLIVTYLVNSKTRTLKKLVGSAGSFLVSYTPTYCN